MRAVVQRVSSASVSVDGETLAAIGPGLLVLLGVRVGDGEEQADRLVRKLRALRVFEDADGRMNLSVERGRRRAAVRLELHRLRRRAQGKPAELHRSSASGGGRAACMNGSGRARLRRAAGSARTWPSSS